MSQSRLHSARPLLGPLLSALIWFMPSLAMAQNWPADLLAQAKAAMAVVVCGNAESGAICIHPAGFVVTVEPADAVFQEPISVAFDVGQVTQKVLRAKVVRRDPQHKLVLLKMYVADTYPTLALADQDPALGSTGQVIAFALPKPPNEYPPYELRPSVVLNEMRPEGKVAGQFLISGLSPANLTSGALIDREGKVRGLSLPTSGRPGATVVIGVQALQQFLSAPELQLTLPAIAADAPHGEFEFKVDPIWLVPSSQPAQCELILSSLPGIERRYPMTYSAGSFRAKVVPFPKRSGPPQMRVTVHYEHAKVNGLTSDRTLQFGKQAVQLAELKRLELQPRPLAHRRTTGTVFGELTGLVPLPVAVGKQTFPLDLAEAKLLEIEAEEDLSALGCAAIIFLAGRETGRVSLPLYVQGQSQPSYDLLAKGEFVRPVPSLTAKNYLRITTLHGSQTKPGEHHFQLDDQTQCLVDNESLAVQLGATGPRLHLSGPSRTCPQVGEYRNALRFVDAEDSPAFELSLGLSNHESRSAFRIWELELKGTEVVRFAVDFYQRQGNARPTLYGSLRFRSSFE